MASKIRSALGILREEGPRPLLARATDYLRREGSRRYSAIRYDSAAEECHVMTEDWDLLVILDACRYDQFERIADLPGTLESRTSLGSCTPEFLTANFEGRDWYDTVYVTGNPMYRAASLDDAFHDVIDVWQSDWDEQNQTVHPEQMLTATLEARETYPEKRIISHFIQPHYPFIGEAGQELSATATGDISGIEWISRNASGEATIDDRATPWDLLDLGVLDEELVRRAYDENLQLALPYVQRLLDTVTEKTVVTSDHGNLLGKRIAPFSGPVYGHPPSTYVDGLRRVPWLVVEGTRRKAIRAEDPEKVQAVATDDVQRRLADLGYAEQ